MMNQRIMGQIICTPKQHTNRLILKNVFSDNCKQPNQNLVTCSTSRRCVRLSDEEYNTRLKYSAQILWDFLRIDSPLKKSDLILVLGNSDLRTAHYAAELFKEGFAPLVAVSGKEGHGTIGKWSKPEAVVFAEQLLKNSVPPEHIIIEPRATNTGENIRFTQKLLREHPNFIQPRSVLLIQTPFMGRRCLGTFMKQWDNAEKVDVTVSSPPIPLDEYPDKDAGYNTLQDVAKEMVRNMQKLQLYSSNGFQIPEVVPSHVMEAFKDLQSLLEQKEK